MGFMARLLAGAFALQCSLVQAGTAQNVLIIVNDASPVSRSIGEYYARKRNIPARNVCSIRTVEDETIDRKVYQAIESAIAGCLTAKHLVDDILYVVTTTGVPLRVRG